MAEAWYCTREDVKRALDIKTSAYANDRVDRAVQAASEDVEAQLRRRFYPKDSTQTFDWLDHQYSLVWRLWLDQRELCMNATAVVTNGIDITTKVMFRPDFGPPYDRIEIDTSTSAAFTAGNTYQRAVSVTGTFGYLYKTASAGTLAASVNGTTDTTVTLSDSSQVGVGSLLIVESERMLITGLNLASTTATLTGNPTSSASNTTIGVSDGTLIHQGEVITVDSERMLVVDIAGNNLIVERAYDGSVLAAHTASTVVYAPRLATVTRAALGTTKAAHSSAVAVSVFVYPTLVRQLTIAEAVTNLIQERSGYARSIGTETVLETIGKGLTDLRKRAFTAHGRKVLVRTPARYI